LALHRYQFPRHRFGRRRLHGELGPLLLAIAVSGRSGSAFAAEIGTMKVTEELDSLRAMALEPVGFVLAPKYLAALISVPCLSIISNFFGFLPAVCSCAYLALHTLSGAVLKGSLECVTSFGRTSRL
jgi:ABC-type transporter Mla maintaining outer membrane lipid asymmetry permease subunit MlaE